MTGPRPSDDGRLEVLRQASVALGGPPVILWEVSARAELEPRLSNDTRASVGTAPIEVRGALRRWNVPILQGSRWVGCRVGPEQGWVIAPVRTRPPAPPPGGAERRSPERLTLELAGLCVGLIDGNARPAPEAPAATGLRDMTQLPGLIAHELGNRLTTARAGLDLLMREMAEVAGIDVDRRAELTNDLRQVVDEIEHSVQFLRAIRDRARGALARWERFDAARVVQSCCTLEGRVLKDRLPLVFDGSLEAVYLLGDPNALYDALVNLIRNAADASAGRPGQVRVGLERTGQSLRMIVQDTGHGISAQHLDRIFESGFSTKGFGEGAGMGLAVVQDVVQNMFGGAITVESRVDVGTTVTVTLPIPAQRGADAATLPAVPLAQV